jgi:hypothetical protein
MVANHPAGPYAHLRQAESGDTGAAFVAYASSGTLNLTAIGSTLEGNFTAQMNTTADGGLIGPLTGNFSAPVCTQ